MELVLDGVRRTLADAQGRYRFDDVPHGRHRVELRYATKEAFFLTTPSPREVDAGTTADFGVAAAHYTVRIELGSIPVGYALDGQLSHAVVIGQAALARPTFVLRPYRGITGRVRVFDRGTGAYVPLAGETAELSEPHRQCTTDENGSYVFRDLSAGDYTVVVVHEGQPYTVVARVPDGPASLRNVDIAIVR